MTVRPETDGREVKMGCDFTNCKNVKELIRDGSVGGSLETCVGVSPESRRLRKEEEAVVLARNLRRGRTGSRETQLKEFPRRRLTAGGKEGFLCPLVSGTGDRGV